MTANSNCLNIFLPEKQFKIQYILEFISVLLAFRNVSPCAHTCMCSCLFVFFVKKVVILKICPKIYFL